MEKIFSKIRNYETGFYDELPKEFQTGENIIYALIETHYNEPLYSSPEDSV